jgi:predicted ATP-dependent endonuclease of OLD family
MLSVIVGNNNVGKSLLLKKLKDIVQNPAYLISEFPSKLAEKERNQENAFERDLDLPAKLIEEKRIYFKLFLRPENVNRYKKSIINKLKNDSNQDNQISRPGSNSYCDESKEQKKGFTKNLKSNDLNFWFEL